MIENDWFDVVDQPLTPERSTAPGVLDMPDNDGEQDLPKNKHVTATVVGSLGVVVVIASAVAYLTNASTTATEQAQVDVAALTTTRITPTQNGVIPKDPETAIGVAGKCRPQDGEVEISADENTVRGAVTRWQSAYYQQDAEALTNSIAPDSWLLDNDWPTILTEAAPEDTTWCVVMSPASETTVDVDVMVTFPDGESTTYPQTVTAQQQPDGNWAIDDIETREE